MAVGVEEAGVPGELRHPVPLREAHVGLGEHPAQQGLRDRRGAVPDRADPCEGGPVEGRIVEQHRDHGRSERHGGDAVPPARREDVGGAEGTEQDDGPAESVLDQDVVRRHVEQRERVQVAVVGGDGASGGRGVDGGGQRHVGEDGTLGSPRRAGGEDDPRRVGVGRRGEIGEFVAGPPGIELVAEADDGERLVVTLRERGQEPVEEIGFADHQAGTALFELGAQLHRVEPGVERHRDPAGRRDAEQQARGPRAGSRRARRSGRRRPRRGTPRRPSERPDPTARRR